MIQHPGEILLEKYLQPLNMTMLDLSNRCCIPYYIVQEICEKRKGITVDTAMRLAKYFGTTAESWIISQARYDMENISHETKNEINQIGVKVIQSDWFTGPPKMIDDIEFYFWKPNTETDEGKSINRSLLTERILVVKMRKVLSGVSGGDIASTNFGTCQLLNTDGLSISLLRGLWNGPIRIPT